MTFVAQNVFPSDMFINQLSTCIEEAENPNWLLSRVADMPLEWTPKGVPDSTLIQALAEGSEINFDEEALNQFTTDFYKMIVVINEIEGNNH